MIIEEAPKLAITMGDPAGIGPEIVLKAIYEKSRFLPQCHLTVVCDLALLRRTDEIIDERFKREVAQFEQVPNVDFEDLANVNLSTLDQGEVQVGAGQAAMDYILTSISMASKGDVDGVVTGPINKESLNLAGHKYPGHTEIFAERQVRTTLR